MDIKLLHRKDSLILTAIEVINELGIQGLSTREIAKRQGVSEATLFRHYKSKNDLLLAVLDYYVQYDSDIIKSVELKDLSPIEAILYCIGSLVEYYQSYPAITSVPEVYQVLSSDPAFANKVKDILRNRTNIVAALVDKAKAAKEIKEDTNSEQLAEIITGYSRQEILKWRLSSYSYSLKDSTLSTITMLLNAFK